MVLATGTGLVVVLIMKFTGKRWDEHCPWCGVKIDVSVHRKTIEYDPGKEFVFNCTFCGNQIHVVVEMIPTFGLSKWIQGKH